MSEITSPKLINSLGRQQQQNHHRQLSQAEKDETSVLLKLFQQIQPVEIIKSADSRKKSQSVLYLNEDDAEYKLIELIQKGITDYSLNKIQLALFQFKQAEQILTVSPQWSKNYYMILKVNLGVCFYALGWLENAFTCFEDAIIAFKKYQKTGQELLQLNTMKIHCYMQCCIILSEIGQHAEALTIAKIAIQKSIKMLFKLYEFLENAIYKQLILEILRKNIPLMKQKKASFLNNLINLQVNQTQFESIFIGCPITYQEKANILSFIQMQPISLQDFNLQIPFPSQEQLLHMICLFVISLYCTSTESRFVETINDPHQFTDAENYLSRALEIVFVYLPKEMPLINQLLNVHTRFHDISKHVIHEDQNLNSKQNVQNYEIVLLKPIVESTKCGFAIPIIRKSKPHTIFKERAKSLKETQFQTKKPILELKTFENTNTKANRRKLRSISTTNKGKPTSPKWNIAAEVYLQKTQWKQPHLKRPTTKSYVNKTVEITQKYPQVQQQQFFENINSQSSQNTSNNNNNNNNNNNKKVNINFLFVNNLNHIHLNNKTRKKSNPNQTFEQLLKSNQFKNNTVQSKIKNLIRSYQL